MKVQDLICYFRHYWGIAVLSIAASSFFEVIDLAVPYSIGQILNVLSGQHLDPFPQGIVTAIAAIFQSTPNQTLSLTVLIGFIVVVTLGKAPMQPWLGLWFHWDIALRTRRDHTGAAIAKILTLPLEFYDEHNPGRIAGRLARGLSNYTWTYPDIAGQLIPKLFRVLGILVILWWLQWQVALLLLLSFVLILGIGLQQLQQITRREEKLEHYMENTESRTSEIITNIKTVKAFATETTELARQKRRLQREFLKADYRIHRGYVMLYMWQRMLIQACEIVVLLFTLFATLQGNISLGHFVTILTVATMAYAELEPINAMAEMLARRYVSMLRFNEFMQLPSSIEATSLAEPQALRTYQFTGKIEFQQIRFGYEDDRAVLQDINLTIEPYQTVALVGRSGAGKSTLVKLLFRYFDPQNGCILVDGQDIRTLDMTGYRQRLAIVHQDVDIFNGTLLDNLTYGNSHATLEQVQAACQIARVNEFVQLFPQGYHTIVGERGVRLSGGQRQRLGIARALLVNPDILVFDEATSSLDYESERSIQLAMRNILGTRTTLIVAHRLSTIREADRIVVLDQGQIVEIGSHEELLDYGGIYQRLHRLQATGAVML